jgi:hypothetical protein
MQEIICRSMELNLPSFRSDGEIALQILKKRSMCPA